MGPMGLVFANFWFIVPEISEQPLEKVIVFFSMYITHYKLNLDGLISFA